MIYQYGVLFLVVTCMTMTSALPPCVCTKEMKPVCGSDGKTYNNECLLKCERVKNKDLILSSVGTCDVAPGSCVCTLEYAPICGTDSVTYPNSCSFECDRGEATLAYRGECRSKRESPSITSKPPCVCSREARQVCGTDGHTYNNPCMLNCAKEVTENLELDHVGRCVSEKQEIDPQQLPTCACTRNFQPICASNGVTYSNKCLMRCAGADLTVEKVGPCITKQKIEDSSF